MTGGIDARILGVPLRSRDPFRALVAGGILFLLHAILFRREQERDLDRAADLLRPRAAAIAALLGLAVAAHGVANGIYSIGGSDAYGYVNQAYDWRQGLLPQPIPVRLSLPFEASGRMQAPLGYREGPQRQTIVPTYAPGLPWIMSASLVFGACGPFLVVPICGALFVWLTFRLGVRAGGPSVGLSAAVILSVSPVVLYQAVWPMSDIPAGAAWTAATLLALGNRRRTALLAGAIAAVALVIRPNLLPVAAVPLVAILFGARGRECAIRLIAYGSLLLPAIAVIAWLNTLWFGSPANSGYGSAGELYEVSNIWPNLKLYGGWLMASHTPVVALALVPLLLLGKSRPNRHVILTCFLLCAITSACYLPYAQFEVWWYLRFFLPAFGAFAVLLAVGITRVGELIPAPFGRLIVIAVIVVYATLNLTFARSQEVFGGIRENERRYAAVGEFVAASLPANAALVAVQHAGSLRFHSGRLVVRFDFLEHPESARLPQALERLGYQPFLVIDDAEAGSVRAHFGLPVDSALPWPLRARMRDLGGVTVYDMAANPSAQPPTAIEPSPTRVCDVRRRVLPAR